MAISFGIGAVVAGPGGGCFLAIIAFVLCIVLPNAMAGLLIAAIAFAVWLYQRESKEVESGQTGNDKNDVGG